jgi:hypothetical protein
MPLFVNGNFYECGATKHHILTIARITPSANEPDAPDAAHFTAVMLVG